MVAFVLLSLACMGIGLYGMRISIRIDLLRHKSISMHWYDYPLLVMAYGGFLCVVGGAFLLAWKYLP